MPHPPQHLFNPYEWGGFVSLHAPRVLTFIDGRAGTAYSEQTLLDYQTLSKTAPGWRDLLQTYAIDAVLAEPGNSLAVALQRERPRWSLVHRDTRSVLLFPPPSPRQSPLPSPALMQLSPVDLNLWRGTQARRRGELQRAERALLEALAGDALLIPAYEELMLVAAQRNEPDAVRAWTEVALKRYPRRWSQIWAAAETAWARLDMPREQLAALRELRLDGPFLADSVRELIDQRIRTLEASRQPKLPLN